jgi:hypothetical protein
MTVLGLKMEEKHEIMVFWDVMTVFGLKMEEVTEDYYLLGRNVV